MRKFSNKQLFLRFFEILRNMVISRATLADLPYIVHLAKIEDQCLGFVPSTRYEFTINEQGTKTCVINVLKENNQHLGFVYAGITPDKNITKIYQIAVQQDARRLTFATALVDSVTLESTDFITLRCATDLESNRFWTALDFEEGRLLQGGKTRNRKIQQYYKTTGGLYLPQA